MEKTFEELIKDDFGNTPQIMSPEKVLILLQQVREATIAECKNIPLKWTDLYYDENNRDMVSDPEVNIEAFDNLPTDRIKTEK